MSKPSSGKRAVTRAIEQSPVPIYLVDTTRRILYCNPACLAWFGAPEDAVVGKVCEYHSTAQGKLDVVAGLCPPPSALAGTQSVANVWVSKPNGLRTRRATFVPLGNSEALAGVLAVLAEFDTVAPAPPAAAPATYDAIVLHEQLRDKHLSGDPAPTPADSKRSRLPDFVLGVSATSRRVRTQIRLAMSHNAPVLIHGPPGSRREDVARAIHQGRARGEVTRLVPLDCSLLDAELLEATLEAYLRQSAELAELGSATLLLLDVDQLNSEGQRVLIGTLGVREVDLRTVATARCDLCDLDDFCPDLAELLRPLTIPLPALASRPEDLPILIQAALEEANAKQSKQLEGVTREALDLLVNHPWHRDVAELWEVIGHAHRRASGPFVTPGDLPERLRLTADAERFPARAVESIVLDEYLESIEAELLRRALRQAKGNRAQAARLLGISRTRLLRRLATLGLEDT